MRYGFSSISFSQPALITNPFVSSPTFWQYPATYIPMQEASESIKSSGGLGPSSPPPDSRGMSIIKLWVLFLAINFLLFIYSTSIQFVIIIELQNNIFSVPFVTVQHTLNIICIALFFLHLAL